MGVMLARRGISRQRLSVALCQVEHHIGGVTGGLGRACKGIPRATQPLARAGCLDQQIGDTQRFRRGGTDQIGGFVVAVIGHPGLPA